MYQAAVHDRADMDLHTEVPLVALLGGMYLGVSGLVGILGRRRGVDKGGIHHGAALDQLFPLGEHVVDRVHQLRGQLMRFKEMPEIEGRGLVRQGVLDEFQAGKTAHGFDLVQGIFHPGIGQTEPIRHEVGAQHATQGLGLTSAFAGLGVVGLDYGFQGRPSTVSISSRNCSRLVRFF
jgi:hypothetical protein